MAQLNYKNIRPPFSSQYNNGKIATVIQELHLSETNIVKLNPKQKYQLFGDTREETVYLTNNEGMYSITSYSLAQKHAKLLLQSTYEELEHPFIDCPFKNITNIIDHDGCLTCKSACIVDCAAGSGGDPFSFSRIFPSNTFSLEKSEINFSLLENNVDQSNFKDKVSLIINKSFLECINESWFNQACIYLDPPWGGPGYSKQAIVDLFIDGMPLSEIAQKIYMATPNSKILALKLPHNFNFEKFISAISKFWTKKTLSISGHVTLLILKKHVDILNL